MPTATVDIRDFKNLYRRTRELQPELHRELKKRLRGAGKIGADAAKLKIREWPVQGGISAKAGGRMHRGLRTRLASNIRVSAGGRNVVIRQGARGLTGNSAADLPRDIDRGGWYHPVYGHLIHQNVRSRVRVAALNKAGVRHLPVRQGKVFQSGWPYFKKEIGSKYPEMVAEVAKVLDDIERRLT